MLNVGATAGHRPLPQIERRRVPLPACPAVSRWRKATAVPALLGSCPTPPIVFSNRPPQKRYSEPTIMSEHADRSRLDAMHHVAIPVTDVQKTVDWYLKNFQDETWAMLELANIRLALVSREQHPPHIGFMRPDAEQFGRLRPHRDGTRSVYVEDPAGNCVEILKQE
jgi:hypothetical protein